MIKYIRQLFSSANKTTQDSGALPQKAVFDEAQLAALNQLLTILTCHMSQGAEITQEKIKSAFLDSESFFTAVTSADDEGTKKIYLYVDLKETEEAIFSARDLCSAHGLENNFNANADQPVAIVLREFDAWLGAHKFRFLQDRQVDWGYAGIILQDDLIDTFISAAAELGIQFELGCEE